MTSTIKIITFTSLIFIGYYIFYIEYNRILYTDLLKGNYKIEEKKEIIKAKKLENNEESLEKNNIQLENKLINRKLKIKKNYCNKRRYFF